MPTGYTHAVQTGKVQDFPTFALDCARAFGALVMMRDDPADAPIPEAFEPSDYHRREREKAAAELQQLQSMTWDEIVAAACADNDAAVARWEAYREEQGVQRRRYEAMLEQARAWVPPSPDHTGLRDFMVEQLTGSIDFDCCHEAPRPAFRTPDEWHRDRIAKAQRDVEYHTAEDQKERERTEGRNRWLRQLRESLAAAPTR